MLSSLDVWQMLQPSSEINDNVSGPNTPVVSTATGWKEWEGPSLHTSPSSLFPPWQLLAPDSFVALARYEGAKLSVQVASHTNSLPRSQGTSVMPSGLLLSLLNTGRLQARWDFLSCRQSSVVSLREEWR